ncbi:MAG: phosphate-starvation-inducible PsiE family protein [Candidatus Dormibacteria bacterium]
MLTSEGPRPNAETPPGAWLDRTGRWIETVIYVAGGIFLVGAAVLLLVDLVRVVWVHLNNSESAALTVLDHVLLIFVLVELFHTVRLAIRTHELDAQPFLVVALIAGIRRILVITAGTSPIHSNQVLDELLLLVVLIIAISAALLLLRITGSGHWTFGRGSPPLGAAEGGGPVG